MLKVAVSEAYDLRAECAKFDADLIAKMEKVSPEYAKLGALAYRQTVAAHKLCEINGKRIGLLNIEVILARSEAQYCDHHGTANHHIGK